MLQNRIAAQSIFVIFGRRFHPGTQKYLRYNSETSPKSAKNASITQIFLRYRGEMEVFLALRDAVRKQKVPVPERGNQHLGVLFFGYCRAVGAVCESIEFVAGEVMPMALGEVGALYGLSAAGG